jgi:hypothetical protein
VQTKRDLFALLPDEPSAGEEVAFGLDNVEIDFGGIGRRRGIIGAGSDRECRRESSSYEPEAFHR